MYEKDLFSNIFEQGNRRISENGEEHMLDWQWHSKFLSNQNKCTLIQ